MYQRGFDPHLTGVVLSLPQAMAGVADASRRQGLTDRMTGVAGDFFDSVPAADLYLLKFVLHDWSDESCVKILSNIRQAMNPVARLFIVEMMFTHQANSISTALMDVAMLFSLTGQERDLAIVETTALHRPYQLIEAQAPPGSRCAE